MSIRFLGPDPVESEVDTLLDALAAGKAPRDVERRMVDVKEEPGRRRGATILPGQPRSDPAAACLAEEAACFANSPGGGALVIGVGDDGQRIGTSLDAEWLRHRIYQLTDARLTVTVREGLLDAVRILVVVVPEALEPVRFRSRVRWRVADSCVEVDVASWWSGRLHRLGYDWSAAPSSHLATEGKALDTDIARRYLRSSREAGALELVELSDLDLLRRIDAVTGDGT